MCRYTIAALTNIADRGPDKAVLTAAITAQTLHEHYFATNGNAFFGMYCLCRIRCFADSAQLG